MYTEGGKLNYMQLGVMLIAARGNPQSPALSDSSECRSFYSCFGQYTTCVVKTFLDFGFFYNVNQNLKALCDHQSSQRTSWETEVYSNRFKRSWFVICDWCILICFVCFCVSRFVAFELRSLRVFMLQVFQLSVFLPSY